MREDRVQHQERGQGSLIKHRMLLSEYYRQGDWNPVEQETGFGDRITQSAWEGLQTAEVSFDSRKLLQMKRVVK